MTRQALLAAFFAWLGLSGGSSPPPHREPKAVFVLYWQEYQRQEQDQEAVLKKAREARSRPLPRAWVNPTGTITSPRFTREIDDAYFNRLANDPVAAVRSLIDGAFTQADSDASFARRIELISLTLEPGGANTDTALADIRERIVAAPEAVRAKVRDLITQVTWSLSKDVLARVRAKRLSPAVAVRFGLATGGRDSSTLLVLGLTADPAPAEAVTAWGRSDEVRKFDKTGLDFLRNEDVSPGEVQAFVQGLRRSRLVSGEQLRAEYKRQLGELRRLAPALHLDDASLAFAAGLRGTNESVVPDLVKLVHGPTRDKVEARLKEPPMRVGR